MYRHFGEEIPKGLIPPELQDVEQWYWQAFWDLSGDRHQGGPIPWTAIKQYFDVEGFGRFADFQRILRLMDSFYMKAVSEKHKAK